MPPIYYSPCADCKHKNECYYGTLTYCDACSFAIYKKRYEDIVHKVMDFLHVR